MTLRIAFDATILKTSQPTGVEKSFLNLLQALSEQPRWMEFFLVGTNFNGSNWRRKNAVFSGGRRNCRKFSPKIDSISFTPR